MNISHEWLSRFVPHGRSPEAIRDLLTAHVATVEGLERLRADLVPFVVGKVVASERIPETKLSFNRVDDGSGGAGACGLASVRPSSARGRSPSAFARASLAAALRRRSASS